jgi:hypothetical protein
MFLFYLLLLAYKLLKIVTIIFKNIYKTKTKKILVGKTDTKADASFKHGSSRLKMLLNIIRQYV